MFQEHLISDWQELLSLLHDNHLGSNWYFRCERECDWELKSTLGRAVPDPDFRADAENLIIGHFRSGAQNYFPFRFFLSLTSNY
jgi:hypothetical protein